jgi:hypothetical protein
MLSALAVFLGFALAAKAFQVMHLAATACGLAPGAFDGGTRLFAGLASTAAPAQFVRPLA